MSNCRTSSALAKELLEFGDVKCLKKYIFLFLKLLIGNIDLDGSL